MRILASLPQDDWKKVGPAARFAEQAGFDGVATSELANEPFAALTLATVATERVELRTSIAVAFPRSPMVIANQGWDLNANSGGRFRLGLGSQVKGHNERRFSVPWRDPVGRLREYVQAVRAIWRTWEHGEKLAFEGEHYNFSLMTPEFSPPATGLPLPRIDIAAVGPDMLRMAGRICDGALLHGFCTRRYIENVCLPQIAEGLEASGRRREEFEVSGGGFVCTGPDEETVAKKVDWARYRVGFYGSTRTYRKVFEQHDLGDLGDKLHHLSVKGQWDQLAGEVSDDVVRLFAAVGTYGEIGKAVEERYGGVVDTLRLEILDGADLGVMREVAQDVQRVDSPYRGAA